jgi:hypothetical protein
MARRIGDGDQAIVIRIARRVAPAHLRPELADRQVGLRAAAPIRPVIDLADGPAPDRRHAIAFASFRPPSTVSESAWKGLKTEMKLALRPRSG